MRAIRERIVAHVAALERSAQPSAILIQSYRHSDVQTPGWILKRAKTLEATGRPGVRRLTQLTLAARDAVSELLKLDVYETDSAQTARSLLIELLTSFQSLPEKIVVGSEVGEMDIILPGDSAGVFTRGNLLVTLANAGTRMRPVRELARAFDASLIAQPASRERSKATSESAPRATMRKFVSMTGSLRQQDDGSVVAEDAAAPAAYLFDEADATWHEVEDPDEGPRQPPRRTRKGRS